MMPVEIKGLATNHHRNYSAKNRAEFIELLQQEEEAS
jgi:predicted deacetylase